MAQFDTSVYDDYVTNVTTVALQDFISYTTSFSIESVTIVMTIGYDSRLKQRWIILESLTGVLLLKQTYLTEDKRIDLNFNSNLLGLSYFVTLVTKDEAKNIPTDYDFLDWSKNFELLFIGVPYELEERWRLNYRIRKVGN